MFNKKNQTTLKRVSGLICMKNSSEMTHEKRDLNLRSRAEETNGHEWWALNSLLISLTKVQIIDMTRQTLQWETIMQYFGSFWHLFNFYMMGFAWFFLHWKDKFKCIHILWRLESDHQDKTNSYEVTRSHGSCSKRSLIG